MIDNYGLWEQHDREENERISRLPLCGYCGEPIQSEKALKIGGELMCECCMAAHMVWVEDEMEEVS